MFADEGINEQKKYSNNLGVKGGKSLNCQEFTIEDSYIS